MNKKDEMYHFIIDQQDIEKLKKMVDDVYNDLISWIDVTFTQEGLEFAEMLWGKDISRAVIARSLKYGAEPLG